MPISFDNNDDSIDGSSTIVRATASTTWTAYPIGGTKNIYRFEITNDVDNPGGRRIWVAYSSGASNYVSLAPGDSWEELPRNKTQIWVRTASNTATFSLHYTYES